MSDYLYLFGSLILVTLSQLLLKKGVGKVDKSGIDGIIRIIFQKHVLLGLFLNALAAILWLLALSSFDLSYIFPFLSLNYILIPLLASILFNEQLTGNRKLGIGIICLGLICVAFS